MTDASTDAAARLAEAKERAAVGDGAGALIVIDEVLAQEPRNVAALMMKADHFAALGDMQNAAALYNAVARTPPNSAPSEMRAEIARAQAMVLRQARNVEDQLRSHLEQRGLSGSAVNPRFNRALDVLVGRRRAYAPAPRYFFYPELAPIQFFDKAQFPFLDRVEAAWSDIRDELNAIDNRGAEFEPYLKSNPKRPPKQTFGLADNLAWSAYFLIKDGERMPGAARCPKTMAALDDAPLTDIPRRSPSVLFSRLLPGAQIPPHHGMINARLICHLAVIAPADCHLRVGNETREWKEGEAWVFDDTIEHEARNGSDCVRTVLLFDIWRPELDESERAAIRALCEAIDQMSGRREWD